MKFAICNEMYEGWDFESVCRSAAGIGYSGLELAPFTLAPLVTDIPQEARRTYRRQAEDVGLSIIGLHWLLAKTTGFHLNSTDPAVRRRTALYLAEQVRLCADLGGELMVFGSPGARQVPPGVSMDEAFELAADTIRQMTGVLAERNVRLCIEPLAPNDTNFIQTAEEGVRLIRMVGHPNVVLHLDVKAMATESTPIPDLIRTHAGQLGHFHANDVNLLGPGMGAIDFRPIFGALVDVHYHEWVSVEVFDFRPGPETIARRSLEYMRQVHAACTG